MASNDENQTFPMKCSALRKGGMLMIQVHFFKNTRA